MKKIFSFLLKDTGKLIAGLLLFAAALISELLSFDIASLILYICALLMAGHGVYISAVKGIVRRDFLDEKFLMSIASIGAMIVGEYSEGVAVMLFFLLGEIFEKKAVSRSRGKIRALLDICPDEATVIREGVEEVVDADEVAVGDIMLIRPGERVAADCRVISGSADVDTSAITGESIPRAVHPSDILESGVIVLNAALHCEAIRESSDSGAQRILDMVENASDRKSKEESFITSFAKVYTPIVVSLAILLATLPSIIGITEWSESVYRALIFLVISCPCALVISVPLAFFGGIGAAASRGILFKGGSSFAPLASARVVAFDKTGTLTEGKFVIKEIYPEGVSKETLIELASAVEYGSSHPIASALRACGGEVTPADNIEEYSGKGAVGYVGGIRIAVGNARLMEDEGARIPLSSTDKAGSRVYVSQGGEYVGAFLIKDSIKPEACEAITALRTLGIRKTVMLSGDKRTYAEAIACELSLDEFRAELLPEDKYSAIEEYKAEGKVMYVGDGINDAPALTYADVGVAMGLIGSDAAIETADAVIASDNLLRLPEAVRIARKTLMIAKSNIAFALTVKIAIMILGAFGIANMWLAVFADVGVAVLAILNSMRVLAFKGK
ncbi:MAG: cadmium-translocating P-type ATPase [Ruminococcaceae bacterium]|nr:cadmium-translocating P-type ATPase [Oscillospiraceae bacterium]